MKSKDKRLKEAMEYLDYCAHEGQDIDIEGMTDEKIIELADHMSEQGELAYDAWKERFT